MRVLALALAGLALSAWAASSGESQTSQARSRAVASCSGSQLRISLPRRFAGLGHVNGDLRFTNVGGTRCRLAGWSSVVAVEADGKTIDAKRISARAAWALSWPPTRPVRPVVLRRGASAYAELDGGDTPVGRETSCPTAHRLRIGVPGGRPATMLPALWWKSAGRPVYFALCGGIAISPFFPASALPK